MISEIKSYLKTLALSVSSLPEAVCYLAAKEEATYKLPGWISILAVNAKPVKTMVKDNCINAESKITVVTQKYTVSQPVKIAFSGVDEVQVTGWITAFLEQLASGIKINNIWVDIKPTDISYTDSNSQIRSQYIGVMTLEFNYGIYSSRDMAKLKDIKLQGVNNE